MQRSEEQYMERTPDLVSKISKLREAAEKEMNRFTSLSDYDVRRVVGQGPRPAPVPAQTISASTPESRTKRPVTKPTTTQTSIEFSPAPAEQGDDGEAA
jgi:hypothetical protein